MPLTQKQIEGFASLAYNLYQQRKFEDARKIFLGLTGVAPHSYYGYAGLGALALAANPPDLEAAFTNLKRATELNSSDPCTHENLGQTLLRQGKREQAAVEFYEAWFCRRERNGSPTPLSGPSLRGTTPRNTQN